MTRLAAAILCLLLFPLGASAADINAASCSQPDVQAAINAAANGDRILVPAGKCTWGTHINVGTKNLVLQGAGRDSTIITLSGVVHGVVLGMTSSRVTGFGFTMLSGTNFVLLRGQNFRVDNNRFDNQVGSLREAVSIAGDTKIPHPRGVIDNNEFINSRVLVRGDLSLLAHALWWAEPLNLGSQNSVFIEDNVFSFNINAVCVDANYGGRYVFRYNTITNSSVHAHSVQGNHRATRSWEIYENTIHSDSGVGYGFAPIWLRGGTGVIFSNKITGSWNVPAPAFDSVRSFNPSSMTFPPGKCDGTSPWDGNQGKETEAGYPCRDQIGRSTDAFLWTDADPYPPQTLEPAYVWNNTLNGNLVLPRVINNDGPHIQAGRDYINQPMPGYTPFTYPHPLRDDGSGAPAPPTELKGTVRP